MGWGDRSTFPAAQEIGANFQFRVSATSLLFSSRNPLHQPFLPAVPHSVSWVAMRTYATILCLLLTVPAFAVDTLTVEPQPEPLSEAWRWTEFNFRR